MYSLRPAALRLLSSSTLFLVKPRSITTFSPSALRLSRPSPRFPLQRRWNSDAAPKEPVPENAAENAAGETEKEASGVSADESDARVLESAIQAAAEASPAVVNEVSENAEAAAASEQEAEDLGTPTRRPSFVTPPEPKETVYIGNLFFDVTADDLKQQMSKYGTVEFCKIIHDGRGLSKGFGYVGFDSVDAAARAIEGMHMQVFEGRRTVVQYAQTNFKQGRVTAPPSKTLFIGNLAWEMTDKDLHELFKDVHNVIDVRVAIDRKTGQPRGFAHAEFIDVPSAQAALEVLSSKAPYGRRLRLNYSFGSKRNSNREEVEQQGEQEPQEFQ